VIHKTQVMVRLPDKRWATAMEARRREIKSTIDLLKDHSEVPDIVQSELCRGGYLDPRHGLTICSLDGTIIDDGSEFECEFVGYDPKGRGRVIMAVFVGDGDTGAPIRFSNLFTGMEHGEAFESDRGFLIAQPTDRLVRGWALQPTGQDTHDEYGIYASPEYVARLLAAAR
jgi:hypothetical protein